MALWWCGLSLLCGGLSILPSGLKPNRDGSFFPAFLSLAYQNSDFGDVTTMPGVMQQPGLPRIKVGLSIGMLTLLTTGASSFITPLSLAKKHPWHHKFLQGA